MARRRAYCRARPYCGAGKGRPQADCGADPAGAYDAARDRADEDQHSEQPGEPGRKQERSVAPVTGLRGVHQQRVERDGEPDLQRIEWPGGSVFHRRLRELSGSGISPEFPELHSRFLAEYSVSQSPGAGRLRYRSARAPAERTATTANYQPGTSRCEERGYRPAAGTGAV